MPRTRRARRSDAFDPLRKSGGPKCCDAQRGISSSGVVGCNPRTEGSYPGQGVCDLFCSAPGETPREVGFWHEAAVCRSATSGPGIGNAADPRRPLAGPPPLTRCRCRPGMCSATGYPVEWPAYLLTDLREIGILQSSQAGGEPHAIRSSETTRVHGAARWRGDVAARGAGA
jgi:hypothetical protein